MLGQVRGNSTPLLTKRCQGTGPAFLSAGAGKGESALSSVAGSEGQGTRGGISPPPTPAHDRQLVGTALPCHNFRAA